MRLLVLDVEGTLFEPGVLLPGTSLTSSMWQAIASMLGSAAEAEEVATHQKWQSGGYANYMAWMAATIEIHVKHGLTESQFRSVVEASRYNEGVVEAITRIDRDSFTPILVSGGFRALADRAVVDLQIHHSFAACDYIFRDGRLAGYNLLPSDFTGKIDFVRLMLSEYRLAADEWVFVGDGGNDVPVASAAPASIGYRPHPDLAAVVTNAIDDFSQLSEVLRQLG
jgi:phosphoserine phosphatase